MATTARELYAALADQTVEDALTGFEQGLIYQGYSKLLHDKLFNLMVFKTPIECGAQANNSLIFNTVTYDDLPDVGARKLGEEYTADNVESKINTFQMSMYGGSFTVDRAIMRAQGLDPNNMAVDTVPTQVKSYLYRQYRAKMDALIEGFNKSFISGNGTYPNWKGLEPYVTAGQIVPQTVELPAVLDQTGAQKLWRQLNIMCAPAGINTLVVNSIGYQLLIDLMFQLHIHNSMQKVGEVEYEGISNMKIVPLPDDCFTATSKGSGTGVIYGLRIGEGERDFGVAVPNDGQVIDVVNPFGTQGGGGPMVKDGAVELVGCIFPGVKDSIQLLQITVQPAVMSTNYNITGYGAASGAVQDVNIASVGGTPVEGSMPVTLNGEPVTVTPDTGKMTVTLNNEIVTIQPNDTIPVSSPMNQPLKATLVGDTGQPNPKLSVRVVDESGNNIAGAGHMPVEPKKGYFDVATYSGAAFDVNINSRLQIDDTTPIKTQIANSDGTDTADVSGGKLNVSSQA